LRFLAITGALDRGRSRAPSPALGEVRLDDRYRRRNLREATAFATRVSDKMIASRAARMTVSRQLLRDNA